ncbi:peptidylprolyl isomerase [Chitinophagaceae bacterium MMS25-I14]
MAVIQKIRDKYAKLAGFVIALALVGFILMDAASGKLGDFFGRNSSVVKVNGEKVDQKEYAQRIRDYETLYELYAKGRQLDDAARAQLHDQALRELIYEKLADKQMNDLGIETTKEEEQDLIKGPYPDPMIQQFPFFIDPKTGQFNPQALMAFETKKGMDMSNPQVQKALDQWETVKNFVKRNHRIQKFNNLVVNGVYTPKFMLNKMMKDQNTLASIRFVKIPYTTVNDNEVKVADADLEAYIKKHAPLYTIDEPTRSIEYVSFDVQPSKDDTAKSRDALQNLKAEFAGTKDAEAFVNRNSDEQYTGAFVSRKSLMSAYADSVMSQPVGAVYGPYFENGSYKLTKVLDKQTLPDSVKCRHILIKTKNQGNVVLSDSAAKKRIDSIELAIKNGADFKEMVTKYSDDEGSKTTGGEYDFNLAQRSNLSKEFADFIFDGKTGEKKVVKVDNDNYGGYHYIEIVKQSGIEPAAKLATISKSLFAGQETDQAVYAKATEFAGKNNTAKAFDDAVKAQGLNKRTASNVKMSDFTVQGIGSSHDMIKWMYEAKPGDVSTIFNLDSRYIIAKLTDVQDKGLIKLDANNRPVIEAAVKAEKKAEIIKGKYKNVTSLESLAQTAGQQVQNADSINAYNAFAPGLNYEPKAVGYTFYAGFKPNTVSPGIQGQDGVLFISVLNRFESGKPQDAMALNQQVQMQQMQTKNAMGQMIQEVFRRKADIKYNLNMLY